MRFIYCCGFQLQVLSENSLNATNSKDRETVDGKNSAKCRANFLALLAPISNMTMSSR